MTLEELYQALESIGLPVAYRAFKVPQTPPFLVYLFTYKSDLMAENQNYVEIDNFQVELYTENKDPDTEKLVESKLKELGLPYSKTETFLQSEGLFQLVYEIQLIGG
jgi:hypothetical protein